MESLEKAVFILFLENKSILVITLKALMRTTLHFHRYTIRILRLSSKAVVIILYSLEIKFIKYMPFDTYRANIW